MTKYHSITVKLTDSHLVKLKSAVKNESGLTLRLSSEMIGTEETNFPQNVLFSNIQFACFSKTSANRSSKDINYQIINYLK